VVAGLRVVVTGKVAGESRQTAEQKLREAGAIVQSAVGKDTDVLVTGAKVGATKTNRARDLGVLVVPWEQAFGGSGNGSSAPAPQPKAAAPSVRQVAPMLAKAGLLPVGDGWQFEVKWDGYRCVATVAGGVVVLQSRSGKTDYTEQFPRVAAELAELPDCVVDGELVVLDGNGDSSFERMGAKGGASFVLFDLLEVAGEDARQRPLVLRRSLLEVLVASLPSGSETVVVSPAFGDGEALLAWASDRRLEGVVAKRLSSRYQEGARCDDWIKVKLRCEQEFVVAGYTPGEGALAGTVGALVLGYHDDAGVLQYAGRVGTGFTDAERNRIFDTVLPAPRAALEAPRAEARGVVWVRPLLVAQVEFQRWTEDGRLWHPSYKGLRDDKRPADVRREAS